VEQEEGDKSAEDQQIKPFGFNAVNPFNPV
jgi:hypothetical protein